jgi:putative FmdB family regulatory protein
MMREPGEVAGPQTNNSWIAPMPFYEYECTACKFYVEQLQKVSDPPLKKCPSCKKATLKKLVSAPVFRLKGSGWYETDFKSDKEDKRNLVGEEKEPEKKETKDESKDTTKAETKAESKPEKSGGKAASGGGKKSAAKPKPKTKSKPAAKKK